jgi:hypothetical protein
VKLDRDWDCNGKNSHPIPDQYRTRRRTQRDVAFATAARITRESENKV